MTPIEKTVAYVEGRTSFADYYEDSQADKALQEFLEQDVSIPPYTRNGNLFLFLMDQDSGSVAADVNVKDALSKLLTSLDVAHQADTSAAKTFDLILSATPKWLSLPDAYVAVVEKETAGLKRQEQVKAAKALISRDFVYLKAPPKWVQSPDWQFSNGKPLVFVGQHDMGDLLHDKAQAYVFFDRDERRLQTLIQTM